jgi:ADP-heptose:LPS heptosyltransferase
LKKVLVIKLRAMGDTAMMTATLNELRRLVPGVQIHALVPKQWSPLLEHHPSVDSLWSFDTKAKGIKKLWKLGTLANKLRAEHFDTAIALHASPGTSLIALLSGAPVRAIHNHNFNEKNLYGTLLIPEKEILKPFIKRDLATLQALGLKPNLDTAPSLFLAPSEKRKAQKKLLCLGLGASRSTKIWPMQNFAELARRWHKEKGGEVLCLGAPQEEPLFFELREKLVESDWLSGEFTLSVRQMMSAIDSCEVFVGNDSGPRHVAAALGRRTLTIYGPQDPYECHPYHTIQHPYLFHPDLDCRTHADPSGVHKWCGIERCIERKHECMTKIRVSDAWQLVEKLNA